jgi:hypothetical protein
MLTVGSLLTEEQGKITVRRILSVEDGTAKAETTYETAGLFHDVRYIDLGTLWSVIRPDGTLYGEWKGALRTEDNDTVVYRGITGGKYTEKAKHTRTYRGTLTFENARGALAELNSMLAVFEMEIGDTGNVIYRTWRLD